MPVSFRFNSDGLYVSDNFVDGQPYAERVRGQTYCYVTSSQGGVVRGLGPLRVTGSQSQFVRFSTWSMRSVSLDFEANDRGVDGLRCEKTVDGRPDALSFTMDEVRRALANERTGAYIYFEDMPTEASSEVSGGDWGPDADSW